MFGHDKDEDKNQDDTKTTEQPMSTKPVHPSLIGIDDDTASQVSSGVADEPTTPPPVSTPGTFGSSSFGDAPITSDASSDPVTEDTDSTDQPPSESQPSQVEQTDITNSAPQDDQQGSDDLLNIKRSALEELSPLIDHLNQEPEEKFRTSMMMIQASDNKDLIPQAYEAAKNITDEKKRAQALLDIVNEINYFTHKK